MNSDSSFTAIAVWAPRDQSQPDVAERWLRMIERLQPLHPVFTQWYVPNEDDDFVPLELDLTSVTDAVAAGVGRQDGIEDPRMGYRLNAFNFLAQKNNYGTRMKGPRNLQISLNADPNSKYSHNLVNLTTPHGVAPDPEIVTFQIFKEAILAASKR